MRIIFITSKLNFKTAGGSVEEVDYIIKNLIKLGNDVTVVTAFSDGNILSESTPYAIIKENIKAKGMPAVQWEFFKLLKKYASQADFFHIDAHLFMYGAGLYKMFGGEVPVVAFFNQFLTCWPQYISSLFKQPEISLFKKIKEKIRWYLERYVGMVLANRVDFFSFVSPTLRGMYENFGLKTSGKNMVVGDPINFKKIMADNSIGPDSYIKRNKQAGPITLFFSSRMSPGKGFDVFLVGFSKVKDKGNFRVILGGTGPEEKQVHAMVRDLSLEKYVELPGWVSKDRLYKFYQEADIFIQADWWPAGTSISLLYALAFGVPSILPGGGGLQWNAGQGALYFKYRDPDDLARKIERLGSDHGLREELSRNCYARLADDEMDYTKNIAELSWRMKSLAGK